MRVYFIVYLLTLLLCFIPVHNKKGYLWKLFIVLIPLFLFGALREQFNDQSQYEFCFNEVQELSSSRQSSCLCTEQPT